MRLSRYVNGVAELHGQVTRGNWRVLWPGRAQADVPIGHVTNGVHLSSWMAWRMMDLLDEELGQGWMEKMVDDEFWKRDWTGIRKDELFPGEMFREFPLEHGSVLPLLTCKEHEFFLEEHILDHG